MKRIALFIAIGSIIGGAALCFWPKPPCEGHGLSVVCLDDSFLETLLGFCTLISGIVLLILIAFANLRHRILSAIGAFISFMIAFSFFLVILFLIGLGKNISQFGIVLIMMGSIQAFAFLFTGLSASVIKKSSPVTTHPESAGKTL